MADSRIDELRRRLEREPGSRLFAQLAEEHRKAGDRAESIRVARAGLALHPSYPSARLTLGRALLDSGDPAGARVELEAALRDAPDNILASRFLGQALEAVGELGPALLQLQKTLKMAPGDRQLESQIVALQARLRSAPPVPAPPRPGASAVTAPMPRADAVARPAAGVPAPLPATIRIRMPGELAGRPQAAGPPPLPPSIAPGVRAAGAPAATPRVPPASPQPPRPAAAPLAGSAVAEAVGAAVQTGAPLFAEPYRPPDASAPPPSPTPPPGPATADERVLEEQAAAAPSPLASSTLAELYYRQGLADRAIEVYQQLLADEPRNERARARLAELAGVGSAGPEDSRTARRMALEKTIASLESLLAALRRQ